ncbi:glycogen debranching N-terminal domain-containing protein [Phytomonospora endophytica]|uniref:Glycogen debranching enzyme n=1 Tax=Phytomonospora endophytica TaxID=714109 RepID=A0A841FQT3_9ACTN|nr:glycogen debranching N-terminal domain-containing protein [Phytomonospora endophytica]MBB6036148.1 glycogen debranching enzyme [Phytomonospora endophytica]GIG67051.1 amylo-alpha-1,6-glucosidase [Phytomonospora endophytica]
MTPGRQPFLHDAVIALHAPTQAWSRADGEMTAAVDGLFHGDRRFARGLQIEIAGERPETIAVSERGAKTVVFEAVVRSVDDTLPDPHVSLSRTRVVRAGRMSETVTVSSVVEREVGGLLRLRVEPDFRALQDVKSGLGSGAGWEALVEGPRVTVKGDAASFELAAEAGEWRTEGDALYLEWPVSVAPRGSATLMWSIAMRDPSLVVRSASRPSGWAVSTVGADERLARWAEVALDDLDALRLAFPDRPEDMFLAAGAPWFLTLFGRDSIWAARMLLPVDVSIAASTLRVLARLQGTRDDATTEEQPGKIPHELRAATFTMPGEGITLPPLYYGTVDATALWVCLLVDAWRAGTARAELAELVPNLRAALAWIADSVGEDGFLSYIDRTGKGLSNQGWKDSGDSIQWRDGRLAKGPIALCEAQGYAYEAAVGAADLLDELGEDGAGEWRAWAAGLRGRFNDAFWVTTPEGTYPAIALDRDGNAVDTLTSNIGHLLGTGIVDTEAEAGIAALLTGPSMSSGYGVRTLSTGAAGYWPLGYHGGAVWAHDSAIIAHGMARAGRHEEAAVVVDGLLHAAEGFGFRMPELHSGVSREEYARPVPYPAACRPQAWSGAAAITCLRIAAG